MATGLPSRWSPPCAHVAGLRRALEIRRRAANCRGEELALAFEQEGRREARAEVPVQRAAPQRRRTSGPEDSSLPGLGSAWRESRCARRVVLL